MAELVTVSAWSFDSIGQIRLHLLCLAGWNLLAVFVFHRGDDLKYVRVQRHRHEFGYGLEEKLQLACFCPLDGLVRPDFGTGPKWLARVVVITCGHLRITSFDAVVGSYPKWAIGTRATASTNPVTVTIKDVRGPVTLDGPISKSIFEILKCGEDLALRNRGHWIGSGGRRGGSGEKRLPWDQRDAGRNALGVDNDRRSSVSVPRICSSILTFLMHHCGGGLRISTLGRAYAHGNDCEPGEGEKVVWGKEF